MKVLTIENRFYVIETDETGKILQIVDKVKNYRLISDNRLSENFRILLPLPDYECNYIYGVNQKFPVIRKSKNSILFHWSSPLTNEKGNFDIDFSLNISLNGSQIVFSCACDNKTEFQVAEVWFGFIGGMDGIGDKQETKKETEILVPTGNLPWTKEIFKDFGNTRGQTLGCFSPEHTFSYPGFLCMPWISLFNRKINRSIYFAALEEMPRVKIIRLSLEPGSGETRPYGNWPRPDEVGNLPCGIIMNWVSVPYIKKDERFVSPEIVLEIHDGLWQKSGKIYRKWFDKHFKVIKPGSSWMRRETAFYHQMFMLPEDNINYTFKDIPMLAEICAKYEVRHFMIAGWQIGGHDRGYPYYEPDPRLGTYDDLEKGIRECHKLNIKVSFFVNCQPVDMTTELYRKKLHRYVILDPHGVPYFICNYWGMGTLSARTRFMTGTPFVEMNPAHPEVRKILIDYFKKLVEIGADGLHIDKFFNTPMDFNPLLYWTTPDRAHHEGILKFIEELFAVCRSINPNFCISYEGAWDRLMSYSEVSWWGTEPDAMKAVFPNRVLTNGVEQPYDFNKVNNAVLGGCHILIGPANYNRSLDYLPMRRLMEYIREINKIRKELFDIVSMGRIIDSSEGLFSSGIAHVSGSFSKKQGCRWNLFESVKTRKKAIILANFLPESVKAEDVHFGHRSGNCRIYKAFKEKQDARFPVDVTVEGERIVIIVEK